MRRACKASSSSLFWTAFFYFQMKRVTPNSLLGRAFYFYLSTRRCQTVKMKTTSRQSFFLQLSPKDTFTFKDEHHQRHVFLRKMTSTNLLIFDLSYCFMEKCYEYSYNFCTDNKIEEFSIDL